MGFTSDSTLPLFMRYLFLILLLAGGYYGWDYYKNGLAPRHEALKAMEQEPCPELDAAQARFDEAAELHEKQAERLQEAIQRKEEAVRKYWNARMGQTDRANTGKKTESAAKEKPNARNAEARIANLLEQYDCRAADVEELKSRRDATRRQLNDARNRLQEQIRQVETRLDINRIQRAEASNAKSRDFKVTENRADLLKLQARLPQELERVTSQGEALLRKQTAAYEKAKRELALFQNRVDRQIALLRDTMDSPFREGDDEAEILSEDPKFLAMIAPYDQAVSHEETIALRTEADVEKQAKALHGLQRIRNGNIEGERSRLRQEEEIFFTAAVIGAVLLISILLSFIRRR